MGGWVGVEEGRCCERIADSGNSLLTFTMVGEMTPEELGNFISIVIEMMEYKAGR